MRPLYTLAACAAAAFACGSTEPRVADVTIVGNRAVSDKKIVRGLATHPPRGLILKTRAEHDPLAVELDRQRIEGFYQRQGYYSARVTETRSVPIGDGVNVWFVVSEGSPTRIAALDVHGIPSQLPDEPEIEEVEARLKTGSVFKHADYLELQRRVQNKLVQRGWAYADVKGRIRVDRRARLADIELAVEPGPRARFGDVHIVGLKRVPIDSVRERVEWERGQRFDPAKIEATRGQLHALGYFGNVRIDYPRDHPKPDADITIHLSEASRSRLRLGGGVALDDAHWEVRGRVDYTRLHTLMPLATLRVDARPAYQWYRATGTTGPGGKAIVSLEKQDFLFPRLTGVTAGDYELTEFEAYASRGPGARLALSRRFFRDYLATTVGWRFRLLTMTNIHPGVGPELADELGLAGDYRLGAFEQSIALEARDKPLDPHRGYYAELRLEEGGPYAGSQFEFGRGLAEGRGYVPLGSRVVVAARAGYGRTLWGALPITQRFFGGGAANHRGFAQRRLSPEVRAEELEPAPIGGETLTLGTLETRFDVVRLRGNWLGIVLFTDAGDVVNGDTIEWGNLHYAAGTGLRYDTVAGPLRVDIGRRLNRTGAAEPSPGDLWSFHLSLGQAF